MNRLERAELKAVIKELLDEAGDHLAAIERLCKLAGVKVTPIPQTGSVEAMQLMCPSAKTFVPPNDQIQRAP